MHSGSVTGWMNCGDKSLGIKEDGIFILKENKSGEVYPDTKGFVDFVRERTGIMLPTLHTVGWVVDNLCSMGA